MTTIHRSTRILAAALPQHRFARVRARFRAGRPPVIDRNICNTRGIRRPDIRRIRQPV
ncbi:hypothetical protein [Paraburkholderia sp. ZP32-5]|uniref:hypothetical protein n=1 Tax=Paraburkholderia sp. ZP32-5 TaxID=2883245 RepID=UPI001F224ECF|nr:hypothetical protein [Paraburkholderia sp. ZP32-5]